MILVRAEVRGVLEYFEGFAVEAGVGVFDGQLQVGLDIVAHESAQFTVISENLNYSVTGLQKTFKKYFPTPELAAAYAKQPQKIANRVYANRMVNADEAAGDG